MYKKILLIVCVARIVGINTMEPFIVGGKPAGVKYFAHSAFLTVAIKKTVFVCGASILNQNVVLSAAHCFEGFNKHSKVTVRAGSAHKFRGSLRHATRLAVHSAYNPQTIENDIALAYLNKPFPFGKYVKRVIIMKHPPPSKLGFVVGWGQTNGLKKKHSNYLQLAEQKLWTRDECRRVLRRIPVGCLCGGVKGGSEYAAKGDSGSALVIDGSIQIGLVSFKRPEISSSIVVYTDVSYFYNWITITAQKLFCSR